MWGNSSDASSEMRQLCLDALVEEGDDNMDWRLSFDEFKNILSESYRPSSKGEPALIWFD